MIPFTDGLTHYFDYRDYSGEPAWINQASGGPLTVVNGVADEADKCVLLPEQTGYAYALYDIGSSCTVYAVVKASPNTSYAETSTTWGIALSNSDANNRLYLYSGLSGTANRWRLGSAAGRVDSDSAGAEWHVIAYTAAYGSQSLYIDGQLSGSTSGAYSFGFKALYLNNCGYGAAPSAGSGFSNELFVRGIVLCTSVHSAAQIKANTEQLMIDFGLKPDYEITNTSDTAAIAWAIGHNSEAADALQEMTNAYKKGVKAGRDAKEADPDADITPTDDVSINIPQGAEVILTVDTPDGDPELTYPADFSLENGFFIKTHEMTVDGHTDTYILHIWLDFSYNEYNNATYEYGEGEIVCDLSSSDGTVRKFSGKIYGSHTWWRGYHDYAVRYRYYTYWAQLNRSGIIGLEYSELDKGAFWQRWEFEGDFLRALQNGTVISTVPFTN